MSDKLDGENNTDTKNNAGGLGRQSLNLGFTNFDKNKFELDKRGVSPKFSFLDFPNFVKNKSKLNMRSVRKDQNYLTYGHRLMSNFARQLIHEFVSTCLKSSRSMQ